MSSSQNISILIIKLSAIGDVLMATPSADAIKQKYPSAKLSWLVGKWASPILKNNPAIDEVIEVDENIFWRKKLFALFHLLWQLKRKKFNIIYIMHWSNFFNLFAYLLGAQERVGFKRDNQFTLFLTKKIYFKEGKNTPHAIKKYLYLVDDDISQFDHKMKIYLTSEERSWAMDFLSKSKINTNKIIAVAPGGGYNPKSRMPLRCWPAENFAILSNKILRETNCSVILIGASGEDKLGQLIEEKTRHPNLLNLIGKTDLRTSTAILEKCHLLIANDSAPLHLAAALGIKTISIFGPTSPDDKAPNGEGHIHFYKNLECSPCYHNGGFPICVDRKCLASITPEEVFKSVQKIIG